MRFVAIAAVAAAAVIAVSGASAGKPTREFSPFSDDSFSGICAFTVSRHILVNNTYVTTFSDGHFTYTGTFKERLRNETSGKYFDLKKHHKGALTQDELTRVSLLKIGRAHV